MNFKKRDMRPIDVPLSTTLTPNTLLGVCKVSLRVETGLRLAYHAKFKNQAGGTLGEPALKDLANLTAGDLMKLRNFGETSLKEARILLARVGLSLQDDCQPRVSTSKNRNAALVWLAEQLGVRAVQEFTSDDLLAKRIYALVMENWNSTVKEERRDECTQAHHNGNGCDHPASG